MSVGDDYKADREKGIVREKVRCELVSVEDEY